MSGDSGTRMQRDVVGFGTLMSVLADPRSAWVVSTKKPAADVFLVSTPCQVPWDDEETNYNNVGKTIP